jgi:hypothetical protein
MRSLSRRGAVGGVVNRGAGSGVGDDDGGIACGDGTADRSKDWSGRSSLRLTLSPTATSAGKQIQLSPITLTLTVK